MLNKYKMKKILILVIFATLGCKAQPVLSTVPSETIDYSNGVYFKDINNELLPYVGSWEGILNNKKYTIKLIKFTQHKTVQYSGAYEFNDKIKGDLKIVDLTTSNVLYDKLGITNYNELSLFGISGPSGGNFDFLFRDLPEHCKNRMQFVLQKVIGNPNQLKYCYYRFTGNSMLDDTCPYQTRDEIPKTLPDGEFILTKLP